MSVCDSALAQAVLAVERLEAEVSTWVPGSAFDQLNVAPVAVPVGLSPEAARGLSRAMEWHARTDGAFSPLCGALLRLWDLRGVGRVPSADEVREGLRRQAVAAVQLSGQEVRRLSDDTVIEEGGYAKGQALDLALAAARASRVHRFEGNFGGQLLHWAARDSAWACELADPLDRTRSVATLAIRGGSVSTSGQSERRVVIDGTPYGHILDPRTGFPVAAWGTATAVAAGAIDADCLSTALLVMGPTGGGEWLAANPQYDAVLIEISSEGYVFHVTNRLASALQVRTTRPHRVVVLPQDVEVRSR
ncbi:MAG: FAD:protein FMN transferase [Candidatus Eisenbacteria bacterium]|nr:FAD:protein FMN transferase [Candidatus Eisenbacteria bacterium]